MSHSPEDDGRIYLDLPEISPSEIDWFNLSAREREARWREGQVMLDMEPNLKNERQRQLDTLVELGLPTILGLSEEEYRNSFPDFPPRPEREEVIFNVPLLVDPRLNAKPDETLVDYSGLRTRPYTVWTDRATRVALYRGDSYKLGTEEFFRQRSTRADELAQGVPANSYELIAMAIHHPELFAIARTIGAPGSTLRGKELMFTRNGQTRQLEVSTGQVGSNGLTRHRNMREM